MENDTSAETVRNLEALVASLTELLDVQEKVVGEQSEWLKKEEETLRDRMKELQAFYGLTEITEREGITLDQLCQEFTNLLPNSWKYMEIACSRIAIGDREFHTNNFKETSWTQSAPVKVHGSIVGKIEVGYLKERPERDEGPFLKEERLLINALAERLGRIIERIWDKEALKESNERFLAFIKEAAMRLKNPLEVVEENLAVLLNDIEHAERESKDVSLDLKLQIRNLEQIRKNIIELNKAIVDRTDELSEAAKKFLTG